MPQPQPWIVVNHAADDSSSSAGIVHLLRWLHAADGVDLHAVLWEAGYRPTAPYDHGRLIELGPAHAYLPSKVLRSVGVTRLAGGLAGREVRSRLSRLPDRGVLYLSTTRSAPVLRYLPTGSRTVITHLHAADRLEDPPIAPDRIEMLAEDTDVWLAADDETRDWAMATWGLDRSEIHVVPAPEDPAASPRSIRVTDPDVLRLGLRGGTWFRRDHAPRLVQQLLAKRPELDLELVWTEAVGAKHLGPVLHDLRMLGLEDRVVLPDDDQAIRAELAEMDVLAFTTADDDMGWLLADAGGAEVPMVCFDSHRSHAGVSAAGGRVVPYLDLSAMADAVLDLLHERRSTTDEEAAAARDRLHNRSMAVIGPRLLAIAEGARS